MVAAEDWVPNAEDFPENAQNSEGLAGFGHVHKSTADVQWKQRNDHRMKYLVNNFGKITDAVIKAVSQLFSSHGRQAESENESQCHCGQGI